MSRKVAWVNRERISAGLLYKVNVWAWLISFISAKGLDKRDYNGDHVSYAFTTNTPPAQVDYTNTAHLQETFHIS